MKDLIRRKTSLTEEIEIQLNEQVKLEAYSSANYLAMASWCDQNGYAHSAEFFYSQAEEERNHMLRIFKYINDAGGSAVSPPIDKLVYDYASLRHVFDAALEQEIQVTRAIHRIVDSCRKNKDYTTDAFMQWFINEQLEEEHIARRALELFEVIGEEANGLFLIDQEIAKISFKPDPTQK